MSHTEADDRSLLTTSRRAETLQHSASENDTIDTVSTVASDTSEVDSTRQLDSMERRPPPPRNTGLTKYTIKCALGASLTSILLGIFLKMSSNPSMHIKRDLKLSNFQSEGIAALLKVLQLLGALIAGLMADWKGRRFTMFLAGAILFLGPILLGFHTYTVLVIGQVVGNLGSGCIMTIVPIYVAEISPTYFRGSLTSCPEIFIGVGNILGYIVNHVLFRLPLDASWHTVYIGGAITVAFLAVTFLNMPETPHCLILRGRQRDAKHVLAKTYNSDEEAKLRLDSIKRAADIPEGSDGDFINVPDLGILNEAWKDFIFSLTPPMKHILLCLLAIHIIQQVFSIEMILIIFDKVEIITFHNKQLWALAADLLKMIFTIIAACLLDRVGRRPMLLLSIYGMVFSLLFLGIGLTNVDQKNAELTWAKIMCMVSVSFHVIFYSVGVGPVTTVFSSEIFPMRHRAQGFTIGIAISQVLSIILSMALLEVHKPKTLGWVAISLAVIAVIASVVIKMIVPETRRKRLEETCLCFGKSTNRESTAREIELQTTSREPSHR